METGTIKKRLLVVDDEPLSIEVLGKTLGSDYEFRIDKLALQVEELREMHEKLAEDMMKVKVLCGMLPICCSLTDTAPHAQKMH